MTPWTERLNLLVLSGNMLAIIVLASKFWAARNRDGRVMHRFSEFILSFAFIMGCLWLARADALLDIVPGLDLLALFRAWIWVPHSVMAVALLRLWLAMR